MSDQTIAKEIEKQTGLAYRDAMHWYKRNFAAVTERKKLRGVTRKEAAVELVRETVFQGKNQ